MNLSSLLTLHRMQGEKEKKNSLLLLPYHFWQRDDDYDDHHSLLLILREVRYFLQLQTCRVIEDCLDLASGWDYSSSSSFEVVQGLVILLSSSPSWTKYGYACFCFGFRFCSYFCEQPRFDSSFITATYNRGRGPLFDIAKRPEAGKHCVTLALACLAERFRIEEVHNLLR